MSDGQERKEIHDTQHGLITCVFCQAIQSMKLVNKFDHEDKWTCEVCGASAFVKPDEIPAQHVDGPPSTQPLDGK